MQVSDVSVIVRDKNLVRKGVITPKYMDLKVIPRFNAASEWKLTLPGSHPMVPYLSTPGSGILIALYGDVYMSGYTDKPEEVTNAANPDGSYTFSGKDDTALVFHALAYPDPATADVTAQTETNDVRTGDVETLMREYVGANIAGAEVSGPPAGRLGGFRDFIKLQDTNLNRGPAAQKSPRFQNLGELLQELGTLGDLGFRVVQRGNYLEFEVYTLQDVSKLVRLDINSGTLTSTSLQKSAPNVTRAIVAGQGEGLDRQFVQRTTTDSTAAESDWGLIIEEFIDQRNTDDTGELEQAGDERLIEDGFTAVAVKAVPADDQTMQLAKDWNLGDTVGVVAYGQPTTSRVTEAVILVNKDRVAVGAAIGDLRGFDEKAALASRVDDTQRRVSKIERTLELGAPITWSTLDGKPSVFPPDPASTVYDARYYTEAEIDALVAAAVAAEAATRAGADTALDSRVTVVEAYPYAQADRTSSATAPSSAASPTWENVVTAGGITYNSSTKEFTMPSDGRVRIEVSMGLDTSSDAGGNCYVAARVNGSQVLISQMRSASSTGGGSTHVINASKTIPVEAGDTIDVLYRSQNAIGLDEGPDKCFIVIQYLMVA